MKLAVSSFTIISDESIHVYFTLMSSYLILSLPLSLSLVKVETIGDAYMVAAGLLETAEDHGYAVTSFSFQMRTCASEIFSPTTGKPLKVQTYKHKYACIYICLRVLSTIVLAHVKWRRK